MKTKTWILMVLCGLLSSKTLFAQAHTFSYNKIARPANVVVYFNGAPHTIVRLPVRDFVSRNRYAIVFPAPRLGGIFTSGLVSTVHDPDTFVPNMTIDSFPARVHVTDGYNYIINSDGIGGYNFLVTGNVTVTVSIDIGETIVSISNTLSVNDPITGEPIVTNVNTGPTTNVLPFAQFGRYVERDKLVSALDDWIDYIRISPY